MEARDQLVEACGEGGWETDLHLEACHIAGVQEEQQVEVGHETEEAGATLAGQVGRQCMEVLVGGEPLAHC